MSYHETFFCIGRVTGVGRWHDLLARPDGPSGVDGEEEGRLLLCGLRVPELHRRRVRLREVRLRAIVGDQDAARRRRRLLLSKEREGGREVASLRLRPVRVPGLRRRIVHLRKLRLRILAHDELRRLQA